MNTVKQLVADKTVALVGNSEAILDTMLGPEIDSHDVVIRMNLGLPGVQLPTRPGRHETARVKRTAVGYRTTLWATARYWPNMVPADCKAILWMKLTKLGQMELQSLYDSQPKCPIVEWPQDLEDEVHQFVGAPPGTGIRLLHYLKTHCKPHRINIYGMDCWDHHSHWSGKGPTSNHKPDLEKIAMDKLVRL